LFKRLKALETAPFCMATTRPGRVRQVEKMLGPETGRRAVPHRRVAGLRRGELVALRWRDVDFEKRSIRVEASYSHGALTTTKGGRARAVPLVADVARVVARLGQRGYSTEPDDVVFPGDGAGHLDASALRRRFVAARDAAGLRPLPFHDLRPTWRSIGRASSRSRHGWDTPTPRPRSDSAGTPGDCRNGREAAVPQPSWDRAPCRWRARLPWKQRLLCPRTWRRYTQFRARHRCTGGFEGSRGGGYLRSTAPAC
jgi:hypothetical protein